MIEPWANRGGVVACCWLLVATLAGCVKQTTRNEAVSRDLANLRQAVSALETGTDERTSEGYVEGWKVINAADTPEELREIARHFDDPRQTRILESMERPDGKPVVYTIGDALFYSTKRRFFTHSIYMLPGRNCPEYFWDPADFRQWLERNGYDIAALKKSYRNDTAALPKR